MLKLYVMIERILIVPFQNRTCEFVLDPELLSKGGKG